MKQYQSLLLLSIVFGFWYGSSYASDTSMITIKNLSPAKLTITVKNDPENPTKVIIPGNDTGAVLVDQTKLRVHVEANYNGTILKTNLKRKRDTENYWEIRIRKAIIGGIEISKRDSR
jgi:hypothetical protein